MKDTIITSKRKQLELKTLLACFIIMNLINIYSIYTFIVIKNPNKLGPDSFLFTIVICIVFALWVIYSQKGKAFKRILF